MTRILAFASLLMLLIGGSACDTPQAPSSMPPPVSLEIKAQTDAQMKAEIETVKKAKLEAARYELQLYQEQLEATKKDISMREQSAGTVAKTGTVIKGPSDSQLAKRDNLEEKVIQAKVKLRELEILSGEKK